MEIHERAKTHYGTFRRLGIRYSSFVLDRKDQFSKYLIRRFQRLR